MMGAAVMTKFGDLDGPLFVVRAEEAAAAPVEVAEPVGTTITDLLPAPLPAVAVAVVLKRY